MLKAENPSENLRKNRLSQSSSAYLRQHQANPVDWYPWGSEALERARAENKPIFLSIGYASCHWCHVMERESFSDPKIAEILNQDFICIKLDREERPDLDAIYMRAVQAINGHGGWPLNVFLRPDLRPFFGGTYFPPQARYGQPAFGELLKSLADAWKKNDPGIQQNCDGLTNVVVQSVRFFESKDQITRSLYDLAVKNLLALADRDQGGFGRAPKFFYTDGLRLLLRKWKSEKSDECLQVIHKTLQKILAGGVYDQLGGGFHRYSTDAGWQIPHFEKMLYDNALLIRILSEVFEETNEDVYAQGVGQTIAWIFREMKNSDGTFYSAIDADSEHEEGAFYRWNVGEAESVLGAKSEKFLERFGFKAEPRFEGFVVPHLKTPLTSEESKSFEAERQKLLQHRGQREKPLVDDKVQTSWNALLIGALAKAGSVFKKPEWILASEKAWQFFEESFRSQRKLSHIYFEKSASLTVFLEDYAYFLEASLDLYVVTKNEKILATAKQIADDLLNRFEDKKEGGFWASEDDQADLLTRCMEIQDSALPSPYSVAVSSLLRLHLLSKDSKYLESSERAMKKILKTAELQSGGFHSLALAIDDYTKMSGCTDESCAV